MGNLRVIIILILSVVAVNCVKLPELNLTTPELIEYWGYPVETHKVTTEDEYILTLHRIPHGKQRPSTEAKERPVFFLQHGLLDSSSAWVINFPHQSLGFMLADQGFDVWMGNSRGNTYSREHKYFDVTKEYFWQFSFDQMASYDFPAMINYVLRNTSVKGGISSEKQIYYVGHSQGATAGLAALSLYENSKLRKNIKLFFALAPLTRMAHIITPFSYMSYYQSGVKWALGALGGHEVLPSSKYVRSTLINNNVCKNYPILCEIPVWLFAGYDLDNFNGTRLPIYLNHMPAGTSIQNIMHYLQLIQSKHFRKYDEGALYDLKKSNVATVVFCGTEDWLAPPSDVAWTVGMLRNVTANYTIKGYNHFDFTWATTAGEEVYQHIVNATRQLEK